jgi:ABC-type spermidine/putrescine transport system, permease component I
MKRNNLSKHKPIKSGFTISRKVFGYPYIIFLFFFVVLPLVMILVNAFMDTEGKFTLENFAEFFRESQNMTIFVQSLVIGFITTLICLIIGYPVALFS